MKIEINSKKNNELMKRQEMSFTVSDVQATPSRKSLREKIVAQTNADEKLMVIDRLETRFGSKDAKGSVRVYKDKMQMKKMEVKPILVRNFGKEEGKKPVVAEETK
ncbi:MAG TPA: 30S ribosomal protein S24e [archaeon]|nr:30S ribosomal protein S24e [archaeon]